MKQSLFNNAFSSKSGSNKIPVVSASAQGNTGSVRVGLSFDKNQNQRRNRSGNR